MSSIVATVPHKSVQLLLTIHPPCQCGVPWAQHVGGKECFGYVASRPTEDLGVQAYWHQHVVCRLLWKIENTLSAWRRALEEK